MTQLQTVSNSSKALPRGIQLRRSRGWRKPPNTVVVTRASKRWGNPFVIGKPSEYGFVQDAQTAVDFYRRWLNSEKGRPVLEAARRELTGYNLACFCSLGAPCHRNVLLELVNNPPDEKLNSKSR